MAVTFFVHGLLFSSWTAHIPAIERHLGLSDGGLGLTLLGAPVGAVTSVALSGPLLPRVGSRNAVRAATVGYCLTGLLVGLASTPLELFLALASWGFMQGALDVAMNTQAVYVERAAGRPVLPGLHGAWGLGAFTGAGLGTAVVALGGGLVPQLAVLGLVALAVTLSQTRSLLPDEPTPPRTRHRRWRVPPGALLLLAAAAFASMLCEGAAADWSAVYLRGTTHASPAVAGLGYTTFALALLVVRLAGNRLLRAMPARRVVPALALLAATGFGGGLLVGRTAVMLVGLALLGAGVGLLVPSMIGAAGRLPGHPGQSVAGVAGLGWFGFLVGPPLIGQLAGLSSLPVALAVIPALAIAAAALSAKVLG